MRQSEIRFIRQLGYITADPDHQLYVGLMFQPRTIAGVLAIGLVLQSAWLFLALSAVLWLGVVVPKRNLFDLTYNRLVADPRGLSRVSAAPAPRRFAQAAAGTMALIIGTALLRGSTVTAWMFEGIFAVAIVAVVVGRFCAPANLYLLVAGTATQAPSAPTRA
jgi:hypothetical protein